MNIDNLDLKNGAITINELSDIDFSTSLASQAYQLDEDLFRIKYDNGYLVDVGWYLNDNGGKFVIYVIKNCDWDAPLHRKEVYTLEDLGAALQECIDFAAKQQ